jgi:hypothetical protein
MEAEVPDREQKRDLMTGKAELYRRFERFERNMALIYLRMHRRFIDNPPLASFWMHAALDEVQHASILRFCRENHAFALKELSTGTVERIEDLMASVSAVFGREDLTLKEAFYAALLIEASELDDVYAGLTSGLADRYPDIYKNVQNQVSRHHKHFALAAERFVEDRSFALAFRNLAKTHEKQTV